MGGLEPIPAALRHEVGYTLDKQSFTVTLTPNISLEFISPLVQVGGWDPRYLEITHTDPAPRGDSNPGPPSCCL